MIDADAAIESLTEYGNGRAVYIGVEEAVRRIEQLPSAQPEHCGDAVSRNAIVQKLNKMDRYVSTELRLCDTDKKFPQNEVFIVDDVYEGIVEQLPSVQSEQRWIPVTEIPPYGKGLMLKLHDRRRGCDCFYYFAMGFYDGREYHTYLFKYQDDHDLEVVGWQLCPWKGEQE